MCVQGSSCCSAVGSGVSLEEGSMYTGPLDVSQQQNPSARLTSQPQCSLGTPQPSQCPSDTSSNSLIAFSTKGGTFLIQPTVSPPLYLLSSLPQPLSHRPGPALVLPFKDAPPLNIISAKNPQNSDACIENPFCPQAVSLPLILPETPNLKLQKHLKTQLNPSQQPLATGK